jgi:hypothetical protein
LVGDWKTGRKGVFVLLCLLLLPNFQTPDHAAVWRRQFLALDGVFLGGPAALVGPWPADLLGTLPRHVLAPLLSQLLAYTSTTTSPNARLGCRVFHCCTCTPPCPLAAASAFSCFVLRAPALGDIDPLVGCYRSSWSRASIPGSARR